MSQKVIHHLLVGAAALALSACVGGGGGGSGLTSTPPPPAAAPPPLSPLPPSPPSPPPLPPGAIGLKSDKPFATVSAWNDGWGLVGLPAAGTVQIAYSAADNAYTVTIGGGKEGQLVPRSGNGSFDANGWINLQSTNSDLMLGRGPERQGVRVTLDWPASSTFAYTSFGAWDAGCPMGCDQGVFAYGIPTAASNMPVTGSASYDGIIRGSTGAGQGVHGTVFLSFDFAAGSLSGHMKPEVAFEWDAISLGTYTFRDTVYAKGSTTFSGRFDVPGSSAASSFWGSFTGPNAAELMAQWQAPFLRPGTTEVGQMSGVWIAKQGK